MYDKVLTAEAGNADPGYHAGSNAAWTLLVLTLANNLDASPPTGPGNPVDLCMAKIEATLGDKFTNLTGTMRTLLNDAHAKFAKAN